MRNNKYNKWKKYIAFAAFIMMFNLTACSGNVTPQDTGNDQRVEAAENSTGEAVENGTEDVSEEENGDTSQRFTERDLNQEADISEAEKISLEDGKDITVSEAGVYVVSGSVSDASIIIDVDEEDKVQIVLDGVSIVNESEACIYIKSADKVFITTTDSENSLEVTGEFVTDEEDNVDAVVFSKDDLVINGLGTLSITSTDNAVSCKDTLKITGGDINVSCTGNAFEAHDAIEMVDGNINITYCNDGLHAEDKDDDTKGAIYIGGGSLDIKAEDDAVHAVTSLQIDAGDINIEAAEGIEGTYIQINGGTIDINASDDGINAAQKSESYTPTFEMNDGNIVIVMGAGDTDGVDANGNIYINGGTIDISGQSAFDYDGIAEYNGGTIYVNGVETTTIDNQFMGGPGGGFGEGFKGGEAPDGGFGEDFKGGEAPSGGRHR